MDFKEIVNCIFTNKEKYLEITDKDKEDSFYMINKKFSLKYPGTAQYLNNKHIEKATAVDIWFNKFKNVYEIPYWYWSKSPFKKEKLKKLSGPDRKLLITDFELSEKDFDFILENFPDDVDFELKILKRWLKKK